MVSQQLVICDKANKQAVPTMRTVSFTVLISIFAVGRALLISLLSGQIVKKQLVPFAPVNVTYQFLPNHMGAIEYSQTLLAPAIISC